MATGDVICAHPAGAAEPGIIVPAYNEAPRIEGTLRGLLADGRVDGVHVVVACNGCTDDTAERARRAVSGHDRVVVLDLPEAGKAAAIRAAEALLPPGPRLYLDADSGCPGATARALLDAVDPAAGGTADVAVPRREVVLDGVTSRVARAYYRVWRDLPEVRRMPSGRSAYALSWRLRSRQGPFPLITADDGWATRLVPREDVRIVDEAARVHPAAGLGSLIAVRTRVYRGNREISRRIDIQRPGTTAAGGSRRRSMLRAARDPRKWLGLGVFVVVERLAHRAAARSDSGAWRRD